MVAKSFIQVMASESLPELDEQYNKWCEEVQIPGLLKSASLLAARRYQIIRGLSDPAHPGLAEPEGGYGKYLTIFEFSNEDGFEAFNNSTEKEEVLTDTVKTWKRGEIAVKFEALYRLRGTWEGKVKANSGLIHITGMVLPSEAEDAFNRFYHENTVPTMLGNPKLLGVDSYELVKGIFSTEYPYAIESKAEYPKYYNIYRLESPQEFQAYEHSPEMHTNSANFAKFAQSWPPGTFQIVIRAQYLPIGTWGK